LEKRGRIYRSGLIAKGTSQARRFPRYSADTITLPDTWQSTRDARYRAPPAQIRTCGTPAYGSHLGCLTAKRCCGQG